MGHVMQVGKGCALQISAVEPAIVRLPIGQPRPTDVFCVESFFQFVTSLRNGTCC